MTPEQARAFAAALNAAADQAEKESRNLLEADLDHFAGVDSRARAELAAAIARHQS